jgi:hypothetical protein
VDKGISTWKLLGVGVILLLVVTLIALALSDQTQYITIVLDEEVQTLQLRDDQIITEAGIEFELPTGSQTVYFIIYQETPDSPVMTGMIIVTPTGEQWSALSFVGMPAQMSLNVSEELAVIGSTVSQEEGIVIDFRNKNSWFDAHAFEGIDSKSVQDLPLT